MSWFNLSDYAQKNISVIADNCSHIENNIRKIFVDERTSSLISSISSTSTLFQKNIFNIDKFYSVFDSRVIGMECVLFLRYNHNNISLLANELLNPKYMSYIIYFTGALLESDIIKLSEFDKFNRIQLLEEVHFDFFTIGKNHISTQTAFLSDVWDSDFSGWRPEILSSSLNSLKTFLLSLKNNFYVRYDCGSIIATEFASALNLIVKNDDDVFDNDSVILVLDRSFDLLSTLLYTWSYGSIIHDQIQITSNGIIIESEKNVGNEYISLSEHKDFFYKDYIDCDLGNIGFKIQKLTREYEKMSVSSKSPSISIQNIKSLITSYPLQKNIGEFLSKHVNISIDLSKKITKHNLLSISEFEQKIVSSEYSLTKYNVFFSEFKEIICNKSIDLDIRLKLSLICFLKFSTLTFFNRSDFDKVILTSNIVSQDLSILDFISQISKPHKKIKNHPVNSVTKYPNNIQKNSLSLYKPAIASISENIIDGNLSIERYPIFGNKHSPSKPKQLKEFIIFIVGGSTYEEAKIIRDINLRVPGINIILSGTEVVNSRQMVSSLQILNNRIR